MPLSMTSFARVEFDADYGRGAWELRSVNHRFAEVFVRLPDDFVLILRQLLYFDRYARLLAPSLNLFADPRLLLTIGAELMGS